MLEFSSSLGGFPGMDDDGGLCIGLLVLGR